MTDQQDSQMHNWGLTGRLTNDVATDEDLIAERIAVAAGDGESVEFVEFYELDRRGRILNRLAESEKRATQYESVAGALAEKVSALEAELAAAKEVKEELARFHDFAQTLFPNSPGEFAGHSIIDTVRQLVERTLKENITLKARLTPGQSDREFAEQLLDVFRSDDIQGEWAQAGAVAQDPDAELQCALDTLTPIIAAHVASETEPWRKRVEEVEALLRADDIGDELWAKRVNAYLAKQSPQGDATHPATGGGEE